MTSPQSPLLPELRALGVLMANNPSGPSILTDAAGNPYALAVGGNSIPLPAFMPLRKDSSGRATLARTLSGVLDQMTYSASGMAMSQVKTPRLFRTTKGPVMSKNSHQGGIMLGNLAFTVDTNGTFFKYDPAVGWAQVGVANALPGTTSVWFVNKDGVHFYSPSSSTTNYLVRFNTASAAPNGTLTQGGVTVAIQNVVFDPGSTNSGYITMAAAPTGGHFSAAAATTTGGVTLNLLGIETSFSNNLFMSSDNCATWQISQQFPGVTDSCAPICEDVHGVLYLPMYGAALPSNYVVRFTGASAFPNGTLTQGSVTATIKAVSLDPGSLTAGYILTNAAPAGGSGHYAAGAATTTGGVTLNLAGVESAFGHAVGLMFNSRKFFRSKDGGKTWEDVSGNFPVNGGGLAGPAGVHRHVHGSFYDRFRDLVYVPNGDEGASSKTYITADGGDTFSLWANSNQHTGLAATATHVLYANDQSGDRRVYRAPAAVGATPAQSLANVLASVPVVSLDWVALGLAGANDNTVNGYSWDAETDDQGNVMFWFGSEGTRTSMVATSDSGATWAELATEAVQGSLFFESVKVSPYNLNRSGFYIRRNSNDNNGLCQFRCYKPGSVIKTAAAGAVAHYMGDGLANPVADGWFSGELRGPGILQQLQTDINHPIIADGANVHIDPNGHVFGVESTTAPVVNEGWEGAPAGWSVSTSGSGAITQNDTTHASAGTQALKADLSAAVGAATAWVKRTVAPWSPALVQGDTVWYNDKIWINTITAQRLGFIEFGSIRITAALIGGIKRLEVFNKRLGSTIGRQAVNEAVPMLDGTFVEVLAEIKLDPLNGFVKVWADTGTGLRLVCDVRGIETYNGAVPQDFFIGAETGGGGNFTTVWHDETKLGQGANPKQPGPWALTNIGQCLLPSVYTF